MKSILEKNSKKYEKKKNKKKTQKIIGHKATKNFSECDETYCHYNFDPLWGFFGLVNARVRQQITTID